MADWIEAARPKTLPASAAPVMLGAGYAWAITGHPHIVASLLALLVALALQVGVNYANDYSDGIRGTDDVGARVGPQRLTGPGLASPRAVLTAAMVSFLVAAVAGFVLIALSGTWYFLVAGVCALLAAWFYTGGRHPYGYIGGIAEVLVFVFFGLVATLATTWTQVRILPGAEWAAAAGIGLLSCALLMVNNIRDIAGDTRAGKTTLAVRVGEVPARWMCVGYVVVAAVLAYPTSLAVAILTAGIGLVITRGIVTGATGPALIVTLRRIGFLTLFYGAGLAVAAVV
nr:1,4-dihydroxy-2-naphthoate polyprenyltransferase [Nanchangia anserum]